MGTVLRIPARRVALITSASIQVSLTVSPASVPLDPHSPAKPTTQPTPTHAIQTSSPEAPASQVGGAGSPSPPSPDISAHLTQTPPPTLSYKPLKKSPHDQHHRRFHTPVSRWTSITPQSLPPDPRPQTPIIIPQYFKNATQRQKKITIFSKFIQTPAHQQLTSHTQKSPPPLQTSCLLAPWRILSSESPHPNFVFPFRLLPSCLRAFVVKHLPPPRTSNPEP
jgi:hypothetical protein